MTGQLDGVELQDLPRLERMRARLLAARPAVGVARPVLLTRFYREQGFDLERPVLQRARALAYVLERLPTPVFDDELVVGSVTEHPMGCMVYPELLGIAIWPELPTLAERANEPVALSEADADLLGSQVFPFWREHTVHETARRQGDPLGLRLSERMVLYMLARSNGVSHIIPDFGVVVRHGLDDLIAKARRRETDAPDDEARELAQAVQVALTAVVRLARRYATACSETAQSASPERAAELRQLAAILEQVPARPAQDLHQALQALWIVQVALHQENSDLALSLGRMDRYLLPPLEAHLAAGQGVTRAVELVGSLFIKLNRHTPLVPDAAHSIFGGAPTSQAVTLGGLTPRGEDGVNAATHLLLRTAELLALPEPNLCARLHRGSDDSYRAALLRSIARTGAAPALYSDEAVVQALTAHGVSPEDARDYGIVGCVEPTSCGRTYGMTGAVLLNLAAVLELTLYDGVHPLSGLQVGLPTGTLTEHRSFDSLLRAFCRQLEAMVGHACEGNLCLLQAHGQRCPTPLLSALIQGALERGRDVTRGGARYSSSGVAIVGLADVADSLTAIQQLVFEQRRLELNDLVAALRADFAGHERTRALLLNRAAKYGNDDAAADDRTAWLVKRIAETFAVEPHPFGGRYHVGYWTITMHTGFGALTGALPSGRRAGAPLASGATPAAGVARRGPTASLASTARLPAVCIANGMANNHKVPRSLLSQPGKAELYARLVEVFFRRGGMQVQLTVQDRETLLAAQRDPEAHRDLLVRVSGYTAYFCDLGRSIQDEIIARTEDQL